MRRLLVMMTVVAAPAFAQSGVWTGYVGGWQWNPQPAPLVLPFRAGVSVPRYPTYSVRQRELMVLSQIAAQNAYFSQMNLVERQRENARREADALAMRQVMLEQQERALAEQRVQQAWAVAEQQRLAAEAERRQAERAAKEAEDARAQLEVARASLQQKELEASLAQREKELAAREAERMARPRTNGPPVYKWVDEDGVMHLSTRPRGN